MRQKIATALKTRYASLGLSQKAFDGVAAILEKTITKEEDIESVISEDYVSGLLRGLQGEFDTLRTAKANAENELKTYKESHPEPNPNPKPKENEFEKKLRELENKQAEYEARIKTAEASARRQSVIEGLSTILKDRGCENDFIRNMTLKGIKIKAEDTAESLADAFKAEYDRNYKEAYGNGVVPPSGSRTPSDYQKGDYADEVARLRAEGKIPQENK